MIVVSCIFFKIKVLGSLSLNVYRLETTYVDSVAQAQALQNPKLLGSLEKLLWQRNPASNMKVCFRSITNL